MKNNSTDILKEPTAAYEGGRLRALKRELSVAIDGTEDEELLTKCLSLMTKNSNRTAAMSSIERSLNDLKEGRIVEVKSVKELMDSLNS
jgi:hypothetical protein